LGIPRQKAIWLSATERCKEYYMGEGGGFPQARVYWKQLENKKEMKASRFMK
jgi:hypothetical protein